MGSFSQRLKAMDIYRRIPKDLTEATLAGGSISLVAMGLCAFLFFVNLWGFFTVETITHVHVDHSQDGLFRMNFNITFDKLSCEYASVGASAAKVLPAISAIPNAPFAAAHHMSHFCARAPRAALLPAPDPAPVC